MYEGKRVLVTGGTGMIGLQLVSLLVERGADVRVASLDDPSRAPKGVEFMSGSLMEWEFCKKATQGMDFVFHLAGTKGSVGIGESKAASFYITNLLMNTLTMEAARQAGVERLLYTSTIGVYHPADLLIEDNAWDGPPHPSDKFSAWAKRMGELQAEAYQIEHGWNEIAIVRPATVYGPYDNFDPQSALVVPALIGRVASGENPLVVWGDGSVVRDFIFCRDCAEGMLLALEKGADCTPINLGSGDGTSIKELVETVVDCFESPPEIVWDDTRPQGNAIRLMDMNRAKEKLGFSANTSLKEGVRETVEWYKENMGIVTGRHNVFKEDNYIK